MKFRLLDTDTGKRNVVNTIQIYCMGLKDI